MPSPLRPSCSSGFALAAAFAVGCEATAPGAPPRPAAGDAAAALVAGAYAAHAPSASPTAAPRAFELRYEGTLDLEGHYRRPGEVRRFGASWRVVSDGAAIWRLELATWEGEAREQASVETTWLAGDEVLRRDEQGGPYRALAGDEGRGARELVEAASPWRGLDGLRRGEATALHGPLPWHGRSLRAARAGGPGRATTFWFAPDTPALVGVERAYGHPRLGDVRDEIAYGPCVERAGLRVPETLALRKHQRDESWRAELRLQAVGAGEPAGALAAGAREAAGQAAREAAAQAAREAAGAAGSPLRPVRPGVFELASDEADARSLVVEFADFVVALEAPLTSAGGERMVDAIGARFPDKPLRYVLFGHYHPHYSGGLRAFVAAGARVVAPPGNARFAAELARLPFSRSPDRLARAPRPALVEEFRGSWAIEDATNRLEAHDIGAASEHTDEYVVFYLPRAGLLFEGDLGFFAGPGGGLRAGRRARGLLEAIEAKGLRVERLVQSWPLGGLPASLGFADWKALVRPPG